MVLTIKLSTDKRILSKSTIESTGEDVVFTIEIVNLGTYQVNDIVFWSDDYNLDLKLKEITKNSLNPNEVYTIKKTLKVEDVTKKNYSVYIKGIDSSWVQEPDDNYTDFINPKFKYGYDNELFSTINLIVYNFNINVSVTKIPGVTYGEAESYVTEDALKNKYLKFRLVIENNSLDDKNNYLPLYNFVITDNSIYTGSTHVGIHTKEITQVDCALAEVWTLIDSADIITPSGGVHIPFNLPTEQNKIHNEDYSIKLSKCLDGLVVDDISISFEARTIMRNRITVITTNPDGTIYSNYQEIDLTVNETKTDSFSFEVETTYSRGFWCSIDDVRNSSGFRDVSHLDSLIEDNPTCFESSMREADEITRRRISVYHDKEELIGLIDGVNKTFCIKEGILFDGFNFNSKVDREDIKVYRITTDNYYSIKSGLTVSCGVCPAYEKVCVDCINEFGSIVLEEAPSVDYILVADYWSFYGEYLDFNEIRTLSNKKLTEILQRKIKDEIGSYLESPDGSRQYFGSSKVDYSNDFKSIAEQITTTAIGGGIKKND